MIPVNKVYSIVGDLLSKNNGVTISPEEFDRYAEIASLALFDEYRGANTVSRSTYGRNRTLDSRLRPFMVHDKRIFPNASGYGPLPLDWVQTLALRTENYEPIRPIDEDRIGYAINKDPYTKPGPDNMCYEDIYSSSDFPQTTPATIKIHPAGAVSVVLTYLRRPAVPVYGYRVVERRPVFDASKSTHFDWGSGQIGELVFRILQLAGVSMDKGQIINYTAAKQTEE